MTEASEVVEAVARAIDPEIWETHDTIRDRKDIEWFENWKTLSVENCGRWGNSLKAARAAIAACEATIRGEVEAELAELRSTVVSFAGPWAVSYAKDYGLQPGELHPTHYDILEKCGARMADFRRAPNSLRQAQAKG